MSLGPGGNGADIGSTLYVCEMFHRPLHLLTITALCSVRRAGRWLLVDVYKEYRTKSNMCKCLMGVIMLQILPYLPHRMDTDT